MGFSRLVKIGVCTYIMSVHLLRQNLIKHGESSPFGLSRNLTENFDIISLCMLHTFPMVTFPFFKVDQTQINLAQLSRKL